MPFLALSTARYRSTCACQDVVELKRGDEFPACKICGERGPWLFEASTYRPQPAHDTTADEAQDVGLSGHGRFGPLVSVYRIPGAGS